MLQIMSLHSFIQCGAHKTVETFHINNSKSSRSLEIYKQNTEQTDNYYYVLLTDVIYDKVKTSRLNEIIKTLAVVLRNFN